MPDRGVNGPESISVRRPGLYDFRVFRSRMPAPYLRSMNRNLKRGDRVKIRGGRYDGAVGTVDSVVFQRTADQPNDFHHGYHVILDCGRVVTVGKGQVG